MKNITKKLLIGSLTVCLAFSLTACSGNSETKGEQEVEPTVISNIDEGEAEVHEAIVPMHFDEGEEMENPYYKRATDANGNNVYQVEKASDGTIVEFPVADTVRYSSVTGDCYYEKYTLHYQEDGKDVTAPQYQLYVTATAPEPVPEEK